MKKYVFLFLFLLISASLFAQKVTQIRIVKHDSVLFVNSNDKAPRIKLLKPIFQQENTILICDTAYFYQNQNKFDAFGHVHINQADTINIYSDLLNYDGNTKTAVLTNNVKMVDKDAVLTTNNLVYNMASKVGQYVNGGKIVNGQNTLTSTNGYYFSNSSDAYFRHNVRVKSPDALIVSDTLRYNSISRIAYFYGPTHIYGKDDTLYTENGTYNTATDQAAFGKNNLYTQNSKSLKGDSLFYDRNAGYGRAVKNILFRDTAQKIELRGDLGVYQKKDESITVTQNAYVVFETEKDSVGKDSIWMSADTLYSYVLTKGELYKMRQARLKASQPQPEASSAPTTGGADSLATDSTSVADSLSSPQTLSIISDGSITPQQDTTSKTDTTDLSSLSKKELKKLKRQQRRLARNEIVPSAPKSPKVSIEKPSESQAVDSAQIKALERRFFVIDSLHKDSIHRLETDTAKVRALNAWRKVRLFKSDIQAKSDSAFFSYADSTLRIYQQPILWAQGSQISADTMYIQMKNKKVDNMDMLKNAIVVNTEGDSTRFNQVAGKKMKGYFVNEKLDRVFVDGNAESIYFPQDSSQAGSMARTLSGRMRINFSNDSLMSILFLRKPEMTYYPLEQLTEEIKTLENFSWKPKERPKSKEDVIAKKPEPKQKPQAKKPVQTKSFDLPQGGSTDKPPVKKKIGGSLAPPKK